MHNCWLLLPRAMMHHHGCAWICITISAAQQHRTHARTHVTATKTDTTVVVSYPPALGNPLALGTLGTWDMMMRTLITKHINNKIWRISYCSGQEIYFLFFIFWIQLWIEIVANLTQYYKIVLLFCHVYFLCVKFHALVKILKKIHTNFAMIFTFMLGMGLYKVSNRVDISWVCSW